MGCMWCILPLLVATVVRADYDIDNANTSIVYSMPASQSGQAWQTYSVDTQPLTVSFSNSTGDYTIALDPSHCYDQNYALGDCATVDDCFVEIPFIGSGITMYVFNAGLTGMRASFSVDGSKAVSKTIRPPPPPNYQLSQVKMYQVEGLLTGNHTIRMSVMDWHGISTSMKFDYAHVNETLVAFPATTSSTNSISTSSQTPSSTPFNNTRVSHGDIIGATLGGLALLVCLVLIGFFYLRKRKAAGQDVSLPGSNIQDGPGPSVSQYHSPKPTNSFFHNSEQVMCEKSYSGPRKLVLAFDIGTTYSGISYCILQPGEIPEIRGVTKQSLLFIIIIIYADLVPRQLEGHGNIKVPSILYYDASGEVKAVGSETLDMNVIKKAGEDGWAKAEWWKLHLCPKHLQSAYIKDNDVPPLPPGKSVVNILTDFIRYLYTSIRKHIEEYHTDLDWASIENSTEFIFSHPNGWEGLQQQKYREAIEGAGLVPRTPHGRSRVHMISEGEASLHHCLSSLPEELANSGSQGIIIIDAGAGTIDLSAYSVTFNPIACREVAPAECRPQGSAFVARRAAKLLSSKLEGSRHSSKDEMDGLIRKFDQSTKLTIRNADEPVYLTIGDFRYDDAQFNIERGALVLSGVEAASLFEESIKAIIDAFDQQRKAANTKITTAFLVGGLGANDLVWTRLREHFSSQGINFYRPNNDINKAVGAVVCHIDSPVKARVARHTYGIPYTPWVDESDPEHLRRRHSWQKSACGRRVIDKGFFPFLRKGQEVQEEEEIRHPFCFIKKNQSDFGGEEIEVVCYRGNLPNPKWMDNDASSFTPMCTMHADLRGAAYNSAARYGLSGELYYQVDIVVVMFFGSTELTAQSVWEDNGIEKRTPVSIVHLED